MIKCNDWPIGICSWSLQMDLDHVDTAMKELEVSHIHLAVRQGAENDTPSFIKTVKKKKWVISATMLDFPQEDYSTLKTIRETGGIMPDESWESNLELFMKAADITSQLGTEYISFHAGFFDHNNAAHIQKFSQRLLKMADMAVKKNLMLLMETGQEKAADLARLLDDLNHPGLGVNFDPANMILYDKGDPCEAVQILSKWVKHIHIKDAIRTKTPGEWGEEVAWGDGEVGSTEFLKVLKNIGFKGTLAIEREAGNSRLEDIKKAIEIIKNI